MAKDNKEKLPEQIEQKSEPEVENRVVETNKQCGIVMPIADTEGYQIGHWSDVYKVIKEALFETGFEGSLVSEAEEIGLIHERIVNNLYFNEIVICDVSSKNPNVMFELGLRLAFDKPTIIIKDERTSYSFDAGVIEHLAYPSTLRYTDIAIFKESLKRKVLATYEKAEKDPSYSPFLKSFGTKIVPNKLTGTEVTESKYIFNAVMELRSKIDQMLYSQKNITFSSSKGLNSDVPNYLINLRIDNYKIIDEVVSNVLTNISSRNIRSFDVLKGEANRIIIPIFLSDYSLNFLLKEIENVPGVNFVSYSQIA